MGIFASENNLKNKINMLKGNRTYLIKIIG